MKNKTFARISPPFINQPEFKDKESKG